MELWKPRMEKEGRDNCATPLQRNQEAKVTAQNAPLAWQYSVLSDHTLSSAMLGTREQQIEE